MVTEIGQQLFHLTRLQREAVLELIFCQAFDGTGSDGFLGPGDVQEQEVRALQQAHFLNAGQRVDFAVFNVDELGLDVRAFFQQLFEVGHIVQIIADGHQHLALGILDDFACAHAGMVNRIGAVIRIAEDQVFLLRVDRLGHVFPVHLDIGLCIQIRHDLHVIVVQSGCILGGIDRE